MYSSKYSVQLDIIEDKSFIINTKKITNAKCTTEVQWQIETENYNSNIPILIKKNIDNVDSNVKGWNKEVNQFNDFFWSDA